MLNIRLSLNNTSSLTQQFISKLHHRLYSPQIVDVSPPALETKTLRGSLFPTSHINPLHRQVSRKALMQALPHRGNMLLLDHIAWIDELGDKALAVKHLGYDEFWIAGHFPGKPMMPGVLMIEAAAQLALYLCSQNAGGAQIGKLLRIESVRFRHSVYPGDTLLILCSLIGRKQNFYRFAVQGQVGQQIAFEGTVIGCPA